MTRTLPKWPEPAVLFPPSMTGTVEFDHNEEPFSQASPFKVHHLLVVWNMIFLTFHTLGIVTPTDEAIFFQRGWNHQPDQYIHRFLYEHSQNCMKENVAGIPLFDVRCEREQGFWRIPLRSNPTDWVFSLKPIQWLWLWKIQQTPRAYPLPLNQSLGKGSFHLSVFSEKHGECSISVCSIHLTWKCSSSYMWILYVDI